MNTEPLRFYFDYISSNAYLAWHVLPELAQRYGRALEPVPVLFAGLLEAHGQLGPAEVLPKSYWMWRNNLRKCALHGIPLQPPAFHPFNPLLALRLSSLPLEPEQRHNLVTALFQATWVRSQHISEPTVVRSIADAIGLDGTALIEAAQQPENKLRLRQQTDAALARGVFGVPTITVGDELFWGYDDLPYLEMHLAGHDPLLATPESGVMPGAPRASARRRRFRDAD